MLAEYFMKSSSEMVVGRNQLVITDGERDWCNKNVRLSHAPID
jgi:hypothetical protein